MMDRLKIIGVLIMLHCVIGNANADDVAIDNNALAAATVIEDNEVTVNDIYLSTIARSIYVFTPQQIITLYNIAMQCPLSGGNAVFRARSMYALVDKGVHYDNFTICALEGIAIRKSNVVKNGEYKASLFPNPADGKATLRYVLNENQTAKFSLHTTTGQFIFELILNAKSNTYTFSTSGLRPGVYHYKIISAEDGVLNGKLIIVR